MTAASTLPAHSLSSLVAISCWCTTLQMACSCIDCEVTRTQVLRALSMRVHMCTPAHACFSSSFASSHSLQSDHAHAKTCLSQIQNLSPEKSCSLQHHIWNSLYTHMLQFNYPTTSADCTLEQTSQKNHPKQSTA